MSLLFDGRTKEQKIADAKRLLQENGYIVRGPVIKQKDVKTAAHLVRFFYDTMGLYNPQFKMVYAGNGKKDRGIAKRFIESRIEAGASSESAISECCALIELLFRYEEDLNLSFKITSMGVLGQDSMAWLTERLWQIYEGADRALNLKEEELWWNQLYEKQEKVVEIEKLIEARNHMDRILNGYGKKEDKGS